MNIHGLIFDGTDIVRKNQYPVGKVGALDFKFVARNKQLFVQAQARPSEGGAVPYRVSLVLSGINWSDVPSKEYPLKVGTAGGNIYIEKPNCNTHSIQVRCSCPDDYFMWQFYNKQKKALLGPFKPYVRKTTHLPPRNPQKKPGLCKHALALVKVLMNNKLLAEDAKVREYLNRPVRKL